MVEAIANQTPPSGNHQANLTSLNLRNETPRRRGRRSMAEMRAARQNTLTITKNGLNTRPVAETLGARVRLARKRLGLSQQELAGPQYVASYISAIERDKIQPSLKALELIARRLGEPVEYFLYGGYGSGALQETTTDETPVSHESTFIVAARDRMLEAEMLLEQANSLGGESSREVVARVEPLLKNIPAHQLTEYDRTQISWLESQLLLQKNDYEAAITKLEETLGQAEKSNQPSLEISINFLLGKAFFQLQQIGKALAYHQTCQELIGKYSQFVTPETRLEVLSALAGDHLMLGNADQAMALFSEIERLDTEYNRPHFRAACYRQLWVVYEERGDLIRARKFSILAAASYQQMSGRRDYLRLSTGISELMTLLGNLDSSEQILGRVAEADLDMESADVALTKNALALLRLKQGRLDEASQLSREALKEAKSVGEQLTAGNALRLAAEVAAHLNNRDEAKELYREAIDTLEKEGAVHLLGDVYKAYGETLSRWGDFENAVTFLKKAYDTKK